ncbi:tetratricopeptide repeat protein [Staphylospora marina]|uniref:tetratricopeptide repeat protein n=1 Tax=Staphylospora marina TaxID=2490858 RepID=UPI000F5BA5BD|nr:tetratricopeptide repeat protein [Staphylospora marina]
MKEPLDQVELGIIGEVLRKKRKSMRKRMRDLADEFVSTATISNIERGLPIVNPAKILHYAKKLGIGPDELPAIVRRYNQGDDEREAELMSILSNIDLGDAREGLARLQALDIPASSPQHLMKQFLMGKHFFNQGKWSKAQTYFSEVLRSVDKYPSLRRSNLKAYCCYDLGRVFYYKNDLTNALGYNQLGIDAYVRDCDKNRSQIIHSLKVAKAIYLEKLERLDEALQALDELWEHIADIRSVQVLLNIYETKADILTRKKRYDEAIEIAWEGIEIARINLAYERAHDLWTTLGSVYLQKKAYEKAEYCIRTALSMRKRVNGEFLLVKAYTLWGMLCMRTERWEEALTALQTAVQLGEKTNDARRHVMALIVLGDWYQLQGRYEEAVSPLQKAHELATEHQFLKQRHITLVELSKCWKRLNRGEFINSLENLFEVELQFSQDRTI